MNCEQVREQIIETARGRELSSDLRAIVFEHAASCTACAARLENERSLTTALSHLSRQAQTAPARLESIIWRRVAVAPITRKSTPRPFIWTVTAAAAAGILLGAVLMRPHVGTTGAASKQIANTIDPETAGFLPLPYAEAPGPDEATETIRVQLARESLMAMGVSVADDRLGEEIQADILLGMDGTPRAIRIEN